MARAKRCGPLSPATATPDEALAPALDSSSPAHDLQRMLVQRLQKGDDWMNAASGSKTGLIDHLDELASRVSRLAGPVLLVAAAIGLIALLI